MNKRVLEHENKMKMPKPITSKNTLLGKWMGDGSASMRDKVGLSIGSYDHPYVAKKSHADEGGNQDI